MVELRENELMTVDGGAPTIYLPITPVTTVIAVGAGIYIIGKGKWW